MSDYVIQGEVWQNGSADILARLVARGASGASVAGEGAALIQSDVVSITCKIFFLDSATPETAIATPSVVVSSAIFNALQTDSSWFTDSIGYNFFHSIAPNTFTTAGLYQLQYSATLIGGRAFPIVAQLEANPLRGQ